MKNKEKELRLGLGQVSLKLESSPDLGNRISIGEFLEEKIHREVGRDCLHEETTTVVTLHFNSLESLEVLESQMNLIKVRLRAEEDYFQTLVYMDAFLNALGEIEK